MWVTPLKRAERIIATGHLPYPTSPRGTSPTNIPKYFFYIVERIVFFGKMTSTRKVFLSIFFEKTWSQDFKRAEWHSTSRSASTAQSNCVEIKGGHESPCIIENIGKTKVRNTHKKPVSIPFSPDACRHCLERFPPIRFLFGTGYTMSNVRSSDWLIYVYYHVSMWSLFIEFENIIDID